MRCSVSSNSEVDLPASKWFSVINSSPRLMAKVITNPLPREGIDVRILSVAREPCGVAIQYF